VNRPDPLGAAFFSALLREVVDAQQGEAAASGAWAVLACQLQSPLEPLSRLRSRKAICVPVAQREVEVSEQEPLDLMREMIGNLLKIGRETAGHHTALPSFGRKA
jgi:hypothetical protein